MSEASDKWDFTITDTNRAELERVLVDVIRTAPVGAVLTISEPLRSILQNSKLWPMLTDLSRQVLWEGERMTPQEWKDWLTAALEQTRMVPGYTRRTIVFVGRSTKEMSRRTMSDLIELMYAFGAERGVVWSEKSKKNFAELREQPAAPTGAAITKGK